MPTVRGYTLSYCPWCKRTKKFFADRQIPFDCVDYDLVSKEEQARGGAKGLWFGDDQARRCYDISILPVFQRNGRSAGLMAVLRDVTERQQLLTELQDALARVKTLSGLIPICASCKKVRNDAGYWESVEDYIRDHTDAEMPHGLCPDCMQRIMQDMEDLPEG
jgi:glutaredoxin